MDASNKLNKLQQKIKEIFANKSIRTTYSVSDESVQAMLRFSAGWRITLPVDRINYPKELDPKHPDAALWHQMSSLSWKIAKAAELSEGRIPLQVIKINAKTKTGPAKRQEAKTAWLITSAKAFLADYRKVASKTNIAKARKTITNLQAQQKALLPQLRESNSRYLSGKKIEREDRKVRNAEALKTGRFWEADTETLKGYFCPPFDKNYVADVSEKWHACLILECESVNWRDYNDNWRHKLAGTGRGYLCGIDDNGDEWGYVVGDLPQSIDNHDNRSLDTTVEEAMAEVFGIAAKKIPECYRQGDLLFCPVSIPSEDSLVCDACGRALKRDADGRCVYCDSPHGGRIIKAPVLAPCAEWEPRESHVISSPGMERNGTYFRSGQEITVTHTSHATLVLPPQEYRVYFSHVAVDAD